MSSVDQKPEVELREAVVVDLESGEKSSSAGSKQQQAPQHHGPPPGQANPLAIGFAAFSLCSFVFGLYNSGLITDIPQVATGVAVGFGGLGQLYASIACFLQGETYSATTFLTYSGFFFAFGIMFSVPSGFVEAATAEGSIDPLNKCMGLVQLAFAICSFFYFLGTLRQPKLIQLILLLVFFTFLFGAIGALTGIHAITVASGWFSFALAAVAWYVMCFFIYTPENTFIRLPFF
ncbi:GPR1/FUN34/yaaH family-domain-containing protein [Zychaea mexicana]|uniref:GPR1/FUN34/yaaH family-domain-containing protein n=1 Tax=Zychaea mexicana TaxID=64656 RepID=UPI0022FE75A5|nr:GPR1/FUN34/yaaH family-domain-containing protein [Zychaea mexicana]KAI9494313.1 GPR1/FUN34/yaaH family-domain-containing protein [Zychaea mexicana]